MKNLFKAGIHKHYHLSVVVILLDQRGLVVHHFFPQKTWQSQGITWQNYSSLLSETLECHESPTDAVMRGVKEEFNSNCEVIDYLGAYSFPVQSHGGFEKTVLCFVARLIDNDVPYSTEIGGIARQLSPQNLCEVMRIQRRSGVGLYADGLEALDRYLDSGLPGSLNPL